MLVTQPEEIRAQLSTAQWRDMESLIAPLEESEQYYLVPILGEELFDNLVEEYQKLVEDNGGITPEYMPKCDDKQQARLLRILRQCQRVEIMATLANNAGLFAVSFNEGGGMNAMTAANYDESDDATIKRFVQDAWSNLHRAIDNLLVQLEIDAKKHGEESMFGELWKKSTYYYKQKDLLFSTAEQMSQFYDIRNSREKFNELIPVMRECQETFIIAQVGADIFRAVTSARTEDVVKDCLDYYVAHSKEEIDETQQLLAQKHITQLIGNITTWMQLALSRYIAFRKNEKKQRDSREYSDGDLHMERVKKAINENQDLLHPYIETSPLYQPPVPDEPETAEEEEGEEERKHHHHHHRKKQCDDDVNSFNGKNPNDMLFDPFGGGLDRL